MSGLELRKVDWGRNAAITRDNIEHNFRALSEAYDDLAHAKLSEWSLTSIDAGIILSASTDLSNIFMLRDERHDAVRISAGNNVITGGTPNRPTIHIVDAPSFKHILSGGTDLSDLFYSRAEAERIKLPLLGLNLYEYHTKSGPAIGVVGSPIFNGLSSVSLTAGTAQFDSIIYKGRPLEDLLPSHDFSDGTPYLRLDLIDWNRNPDIVREQIETNFRSITKSFNALMEHKMDSVHLNTISADHILSGTTSLTELFLPANAHYDVVRVAAGSNIITGGTQNKPVISVSQTPLFDAVSANTASFEEIYIDGKHIFDVFFTKREGAMITNPSLGNNLEKVKGSIQVVESPRFLSVLASGITADTLSFDSATFKGKELASWFGSHTFISAGANIKSGGTAHAPTISVVEDPNFRSIHAATASLDRLEALSLTSSTIVGTHVKADTMEIGSMSMNENGICLEHDVHIHKGCLTIGAEPEHEISSFLRTRMRLVAPDSSPIHYALIVQSPEHADKRALNDKTVDLVIRGDGHVGIGAFADLSSKLTVNSESGFDQLRIMTPFTPTDSKDTRGAIGNVAWDEGYWYVKTASGWKRSPLETF